MATAATPISVEEYLKTVYRPDRDYVDGVVEERNLGDRDHALVQTRLAHVLMNWYKQTGLQPLMEFRMRLARSRYRIPDVVVTRGIPNERVLSSPPVLCIEILSPEDRISRVNQRIQEYLDFGVPVVWLVDPEERRVWIYRRNGMEEATGASVKLDDTEIEVPFSEIFD